MADSPQQPQSPPNPQGFTLQQGQQPTPEQIEAIRRQLAVDAQKAGMSVPEFVQKLRQQAMAQQQAAMAAQQQGQGLTPQSARSPQGGLQPPQSAQTATTPGSAQPITPGPPNPAALAVASFLKNQDLKMRTCILNGQRKDMFKGISVYPAAPLIY
jgi:translocation protein SEC62